MAKNYRREKIVKVIKKLIRDNEVRNKLFIETQGTQLSENIISFQGIVFTTIIEDLCKEFDIKGEEIT